jgi:acyl-CoA synthetase (AMP-forming)/AMP-acid ligase II
MLFLDHSKSAAEIFGPTMFLPHLSILARASHACLQSNGTRLHSQADFYSPRVSVILTVRWGEAPHAFVVLEAGATATETELRNYARDHLAQFKCPQKIHFVPELPKTATGKVQKYVLRGKPAISKQ